MRVLYFLAIILSSLSIAQAAFADSITLKNGDRLTGSITAMDNQEVSLKTDAAGEIKVKWAAVQELTCDKPLYVATPDKKTVTGTVTFDGANLVVHTTSAGDVDVPLVQITIVRSEEDQQAYEKSLHPGLLNDWVGANDRDLHERYVDVAG
jgi:sRNA-binding regulator protein Hfq